ncbi:hypothetical protein [Leptospira weilii]|uniref:Uncharacterized protein n=1 Tax=Leptospira weilii str. UI 13098 TaxID=1088542 RepID=M6QB52_9LEPT|nr:hypothetical protein [Leptospira weilii]EMN90445.1 hypothetical protein LEP1GSC108_2804 [Leptospira weilii str. UI 13098]
MDTFFSKKSIFAVSNILNPSTDEVLLEKDVQKSSNNLPGTMMFSAMFVKLNSGRSQSITKIQASLSQNYSYVRKSYLPIQSLNFFVTNEESMIELLGSFSDSELASSNLKLNGSLVTNLATARKTLFSTESEIDQTPENIIEFSSYAPDYNFLFSPRYNNTKTIFSNLKKVFQCSFTDQIESSLEIPIPKQYKYLLILPYASSPTPVSKFRASSKISVSSILSMTIKEG